MLEIKMTSYGYYDTIKEIRINLEEALGKKISKKQKDEAICKALGAVTALWNLVELNEIDSDSDMETKEDTGII